MYHVCLSFLPSKDDAEDLVQEVFIEVFRSIHSFRGESALSTWMHRIAVSKALEVLRYRKRQKREAFFKGLLGLDTIKEETKEWNHPGILMEDQERGRILYAAIDKLPDNQKIAFSLRQIQGMSQKETAEVMGVSEKAVESYQIRAKQNLRSALGAYYQQNMKD